MNTRQEELRGGLRALGFDEVRFVRIGRVDGAFLRDWFAKGYHADMAWMERSADKRLDPELVLPGARSAVVLGVSYWPGAAAPGRGAPVWARYALYSDYHDTIKAGLVAAGRLLEEALGLAGTDYRYYVDTGPVVERGWAARAGLGFVGKNGMLISRTHGNWLFLSVILTKAELEPDAPLRSGAGEPGGAGTYCGSCRRCSESCPTGAIVAPGVVDARRCLSYQTIENRGAIPRELRARLGSRLYGCDTCLEVCPWNRFAQVARRTLLEARSDLGEIPLVEVLDLTPERFASVFKGTAVKRLKLAGLLRNACIVAANTGARECAERLVVLAGHETALVRLHAVWALHRLLGGSEAAVRLQAAKAAEHDPQVLAEYEAGGAP